MILLYFVVENLVFLFLFDFFFFFFFFIFFFFFFFFFSVFFSDCEAQSCPFEPRWAREHSGAPLRQALTRDNVPRCTSRLPAVQREIRRHGRSGELVGASADHCAIKMHWNPTKSIEFQIKTYWNPWIALKSTENY